MTQTTETNIARKPPWIRSQKPLGSNVAALQSMLREKHLSTVCEEAACPNLGECFNCGTATFLIMGKNCTRHCRFCNVKHEAVAPLDQDEPAKLVAAVASLKLRYVVITSVTRDDLQDGGAAHFVVCIMALRTAFPNLKIEILTPDFRYSLAAALTILAIAPVDVFNHNVETVPRLYSTVRPEADYSASLQLLASYKRVLPKVQTKSGIMLGFGETKEEVVAVLKDLRAHAVDRVTLGQYLQPTREHLKVVRFVRPEEFAEFGDLARQMGFTQVASGPMVRSSYHAALSEEVKSEK